jgi:hypothetical protein
MTDRLDDRLESLFTSWSETDCPPVIHGNLDTTWGSLSFLDLFNSADNLDSTLRGQVKCVLSLDTVASKNTLSEGGTVSK